MGGVAKGKSRGKGVTRQKPRKRRRKRRKTQKGKGIETTILKNRVTAIPKGIKMLYNIAKGKPVSDGIKRLEEGYAGRYAAYRNSGEHVTKLPWAKANHAVVRPEPCSIL